MSCSNYHDKTTVSYSSLLTTSALHMRDSLRTELGHHLQATRCLLTAVLMTPMMIYKPATLHLDNWSTESICLLLNFLISFFFMRAIGSSLRSLHLHIVCDVLPFISFLYKVNDFLLRHIHMHSNMLLLITARLIKVPQRAWWEIVI